MNTGKDFERLVYEYYSHLSHYLVDTAKIELDKNVEGPDGNRQCDIIVEHNNLGLKFRTLIECKDYSQRVPILHVDALTSKLDDLNFNKGVIIAKSGFQRAACEKAARNGIDLYSFSDATATVSELTLRRPVLHLLIKVEELTLAFDAVPDLVPPLEGLSREISREITTHDFMIKYLRPSYRILKGRGFKYINPESALTLESVKKDSGLNFICDHELKNIMAFMTYKTSAYLGQLNEVKSYFVKKSVESGEEDVWIPSKSIRELSKDLPFFADTGAVPEYLLQGALHTFSFDLEDTYPRKGLFALKNSRAPFEARYGGFPEPSGKWIAVYTPKNIYSNDETSESQT